MSGDASAPVERGGEAISETYPPGGAAAGRSFRDVLSIMREDWERHSRELTHAGLHALLVHRYGAWQLSMRPGPRRTALSALRRACSTFVRNVYGIKLQDTARIGRRVYIGEHGPIVVGRGAVIGDGCLIRHNVTIGLRRHQRGGGYPRLGRNVQIGPGAVIIGDITIGDGARIGPNAVVLVDVPAGATAFAPPARQRPAKVAPEARSAEEPRT